jgi:hypothetical protein
VVLYGCETWSLTLREEHRLRVFENRILRRIFGPKKDEVTRGWRKLHNKELHNLYSSPSIIRAVSQGVKREEHKAGHSPPSSAEVKNGGVIPPLLHMSPWRGAYIRTGTTLHLLTLASSFAKLSGRSSIQN